MSEMNDNVLATAVTTSPSPSASASAPQPGARVGPDEPSPPLVSTSVGTAVISNFDTILNSVKLAGGMVQNAPYIGFVADIMLEILKIKDEVIACKDKWKEVMNDISQIRNIVEEYARPSAQSEAASLVLSDDVQGHLRNLEQLLADIVRAISQCCAKRKRDHIRIVLQRRELQSLVDSCKTKLQMELTFFNTRINLSNNRMLQRIPHDASLIKVSSSAIKIKYTLPAKPQIMHGRDDIIAELVTALLHGSAARLALLGPGGIGKTSIALSVLHHDDIQKSYKDACYFLACDAIETRDALIISIGQMLGISADTKQNLDEARVLNAVINLGRAILCLDNFETVWESQSNEVEEFLPKLTAINSVHLLITMRGEEHPWNVSWTTQLSPIKPLNLDAAMKVFYDISHYNDECAQNLVKAVDCVPLAVTLLAHYTRTSTSKRVWKQWSTEQFELLTRKQAQHNRLSSVECSIELSLKSPRLKDFRCLQIMSILSMFPDGIDESQEEDIQEVLEFKTFISDPLQRLQNCALILEDIEHKRIKLLSPILLYIKKHHPFQEINPHGYNKLITYTTQWLEDCDEMKNNRNIRTDGNNLRSLLQHYLLFSNNKNQIINMILIFIQTSMFEGINEMVILFSCESYIEMVTFFTQSHYFHLYAKLCIRFDNIGGIQDQLFKAIALAVQINDIQLQGDIHYTMGVYQNKLDELDIAKEHLDKALSLHIQLQDISGQANDLQSLGQLYLRLNEFDAARQHFEEALKMHIQAQDILGQADDLRYLGELDMRLDELDIARKHFEKALKLHIQAQYILGQANDLQLLGELNMRLNELNAARQHLEKALKLHNQAQDILGQANDLQLLGELNMRLDELNTAEKYLEEALRLHIQAQDVLGQAYDLKDLGQLNIRLNELNAARKDLEEALKLHIQAQSILGQANDLQLLGELDLRLDDHDITREHLEKALNLHIQAQDILGQGYDLNNLGQLEIRLNKFDTAREHFEQALKLHTQAQDAVGQAYDLKSLGELDIKLNKYDIARQHLAEALKLHIKAQDVSGQADSLQCLGKLEIKLNQLHEAHDSLSRAQQLHKQVFDSTGEVRDEKLLQEIEAKLRLQSSQS